MLPVHTVSGSTPICNAPLKAHFSLRTCMLGERVKSNVLVVLCNHAFIGAWASSFYAM